MIKKCISFILALVMLVGLVACAGTKPAETKPAETETAETKPAETDDFIVGPGTNLILFTDEGSVPFGIALPSEVRFYLPVDFLEMDPRYSDADALYACSRDSFEVYFDLDEGTYLSSYTLYTYKDDAADVDDFVYRYEDVQELETYTCSDGFNRLVIPHMLGDDVVTRFDFTVIESNGSATTFTLLNLSLGG